jgi:methionyl-tRNA synthetase
VSEFSAKYKADLVNGLGNLVNRVTNMVQNYLNGKIDIKLKESDLVKDVSEKIENLNFREALLKIWESIKYLNSLIDEKKPWELAKIENEKENLKNILQDLVLGLYNIAISLKSFMPVKSNEIVKILMSEKIVKPETPIFPRLN